LADAIKEKLQIVPPLAGQLQSSENMLNIIVHPPVAQFSQSDDSIEKYQTDPDIK